MSYEWYNILKIVRQKMTIIHSIITSRLVLSHYDNGSTAVFLEPYCHFFPLSLVYLSANFLSLKQCNPRLGR